ncbi:Glutamyl-tRNA reductase (GluTR) [Durusdinium trenchii]|uniref:Glutamyl-tRNA reductase (GluTR) n=1 Tax=Durusdinium trenchii TaxID=1381693 RepID=A0ABP0RCS4_9DINO
MCFRDQLLCYLVAHLCSLVDGALNVEQILEEAVLSLRERVYIADGLVYKASTAACDSVADGPHCTQSFSAVTDGIFSSRLLSSSDGGEMLDEYFLGASLKAKAKAKAGVETAKASKAPSREPSSPKQRGRSAILGFRGMQPWQQHFPTSFAGTRRLGGGIPFQVHWEGPWDLVENPSFENDAVKRGRFVAQLQGSVGRIRFGRPVSLQSVDLCRTSCGATSTSKPPTPLLVKGRHAGNEVFSEVVPNWDLRTFVNGVAFFALTSTDVVDEVVFMMAECILLGAIQLSFSSNLMRKPEHLDADPQQREVPLYLTMREGWHATGWEEIEFRIPSVVHDLPIWNLNEVASQRLSIRPGVFDLPAQSTLDSPLPGLGDFAASQEKEEEEELLREASEASEASESREKISVGPEPIVMPPEFEEILDTGSPLQDILDSAMAYQRNASALLTIVDQLELDPELMLGLERKSVNTELFLLLEVLLEALEGTRSASVAQTPSEMTDFLWRQLGPDNLDSLFLRYQSWRYHDALSRRDGTKEQTIGLVNLDIQSQSLDSPQLTNILVELVHTAEGLLVFRSPEEAKILSTLIPSFINGEHVDVLVEARQLEDGSPSNEVRVTIRNADGVELGSQHTQVQLLGNADEIRRALLADAQILSQVKACHEHCIAKGGEEEEESVAGAGGKIVAKMLNAGIRIGKLVRTRTKIGKGSVSVSSAAVELMMSRSMQDLRKPASKVHVGIIGAGKMSRLLLLALFSKHPDIRVTLVNRSVEKAETVLQDDLVKARGGQNATVAPMDDMFDVMKQCDVVFTATGSEVPIIHPENVEGQERPLMLVDISVPLNVAPGCEDVENVFSYSVDDLQKVVQANAQKRLAEVEKAKKIISPGPSYDENLNYL